MRSFQRSGTLDPVPGEVVRDLSRIDRSAGAEASYRDRVPQLIVALGEQARIESVTASNAIEGVIVDRDRVPKLVSGHPGRLRNRSEAEFAGYAAALDHLYGGDPGEPSVGLILHLHRLLLSFADGRGGHLKSEDNLVMDREPDGTRTVRFEPVSARDTPHYMEELVARSCEAIDRGDHHPLIIASAFALDFLCIHPFSDGNGRVARLMTNHLLQRSGYRVGRYVSVEQLVYESRSDYYASLQASTTGWFDDGQHNVWPWTRYLLARVDEAYRRFQSRVSEGTSGARKQDRVRDYVLLHAPRSFSIADIRRALPGISDNTIRLVLSALKNDGRITNDGTGRSASWRRM